MAITVLIHIQNGDPVVGEIDELPQPDAKLILLNNPRYRNGKDLTYLSDNVVTVIWPIDKLNFIEVLAGEEEDEIIGFVRE
jgi:hypothetical protein